MKKRNFITGLALLSSCMGIALADHQYPTYQHPSHVYEHPTSIFYVDARVISATPIYESNWYYRSRGDSYRDNYRETCRIRNVEVHRSSSSASPAGAIIGGVIGAHVGANAGRSNESTVVGAIAGGVIGSMIGQEIDRDNTTVHYRTETECDTRYQQEHRTLVGYDVRYRYNGQEFNLETQQHPGRYISLKVEVQPNVR